MMDGNDLASAATRRGFVSQGWTRISQMYQSMLDRWTPHTKGRWAGTILLLALFLLRIFLKQGWYIVTYALGIYHLNLFIAFLTPKIDPAMDFDGEDDSGPALPTRATEEFRPFIRRLPEFKFWLSVTKSTIVGFCCTFIDAFNIPVFWPILVMYFITLFCITMKRQIKIGCCAHIALVLWYLSYQRHETNVQRDIHYSQFVQDAAVNTSKGGWSDDSDAE